ncbi:MAG: RluA family pseudouridine synthase [Eubacterium sp.]|nr:RluA family pseudouridine synthase [Eubacterium sp.]
MRELIIEDKQEGYKLQKICLRYLDKAPQSFIYKMLRKKNIVLNDKKASGNEVLKVGDSIKFYLSEETIMGFKSDKSISDKSILECSLANKNSDKGPQNKSISDKKIKNFESLIVYEDKDIIILDKPVNVLSQKAGPKDYSINEMIIDYLLESGSIKKEDMQFFSPSVCNRLDRNTAGLILAGKTPHGSRYLSSLLKERSLKKYYMAVVKGNCKASGIHKAYLKKDEKSNKVTISNNFGGKDSQYIETSIELLKYNSKEDISLLRIELITGKSHQIRAHLSYLGYPIIGDLKYGDKTFNNSFRSNFKVSNQLLKAYMVVFPEGNEKVSGKIISVKPDVIINKLFGNI